MRIFGFHPEGYDGRLVEIEVDIRMGLPALDMVGLPTAAVREARDRVRVAIQNAGFEFPPSRILVNLSPAGCIKHGTSYDLAIALAILECSGQLQLGRQVHGDAMVCMGELSLNGNVKPVPGVLAGLLCAVQQQVQHAIVPQGNVREALQAGLPGLATISSLQDLVAINFGIHQLINLVPVDAGRKETLQAWLQQPSPMLDSIQDRADWKIALAAAVAGRHHLLVYGPPGLGKTMGLKAAMELQPDLLREESVAVTRLHSLAGMLPEGIGLIRRPPFKMPHHTSSAEALLGGGCHFLN